MKIPSKLFTLFGVALFSSATVAQGSLVLAGWHRFTTSPSDDPANQIEAGFSGLLAKNGTGLFANSGGSDDQIYGNSSFVAPPPNADDGYAALQSSVPAGLVFSLKNETAGFAAVNGFFLDAGGFATGVTVNYQVGSGPVVPVGTFNVNLATGAGGTSQDYSDFGFSFPEFLLKQGQTVQFFLTPGSSTIRIDNIGISGILVVPEPSGILALGCLLGTGLFVRTRKLRHTA